MKNDPAVYRFSVNFSAVEHARFLDLYEQSGYCPKPLYQSESLQRGVPGGKDRPGNARIRGEADRFPRPNSGAVGTNYNQVVKELHAHFSEKKTLALLYKLERATRELAAVGQQVVSLS